ncbi:MAG TPA: R3H domain-containing nucleic acid-binding protein, partial [Synergistaceae bacterium]|nr:R3H domain-containing nucleic acid-binding protein [Synergistaceae bacterium]
SATPEEALQEASVRLSLPPENLMVELMDTGKKLFGLFGKKNTYQVRPVASREMLRAWSLLQSLAGYMGASVEPKYGEENVLEICGEDKEVFLGEYGASLRSLEYLLNLMLRDEMEGWVRLDSDGYREIRQKGLEESALSAADEACKRHRPISLDPMTSWERRIVHLALKERDEVETRSVGEDPSRRVVVWPKKSGRAATTRGRSSFRSRKGR